MVNDFIACQIIENTKKAVVNHWLSFCLIFLIQIIPSYVYGYNKNFVYGHNKKLPLTKELETPCGAIATGPSKM